MELEVLSDPIHQLETAAASALSQRLRGIFDPVAYRVLLNGFAKAEADEGTLWVADMSTQELIPVFNSGPHADEFVAKFRQPLDRGVVSMVFHHGLAFCENEVYKNASHDETIDQALAQVTAAMIALPLYFANETRGVVSCVRLGRGEFDAEALEVMQHTVAVLERLIDWHLFRRALDLDEF